MIKHTKACRGFQKARLKAQRAFDKLYPNCCKVCGGAGEVFYTENGAPHGEGYWPMEMSDVCDACVGHDKCPLCGSHIVEVGDDDWKCIRCRWTENSMEKILRPPDWDGDCGCDVGEPDLLDFEIDYPPILET